MDSASKSRRGAHEIKLDFKILTAYIVVGRSSFAEFDKLWDEANAAACEVMNSLTLAEYVSLLREMERWHMEQRDRPHPATSGDRA